MFKYTVLKNLEIKKQQQKHLEIQNSSLGSWPSGLSVPLLQSALFSHQEEYFGSPNTSTGYGGEVVWKTLIQKVSEKESNAKKITPSEVSDKENSVMVAPAICFPPTSSKTISMMHLLFSEAIITWNVSIEKSSTGETPSLSSCMKVSDSWAGIINMDYRDVHLPSGIKRQVLSKWSKHCPRHVLEISAQSDVSVEDSINNEDHRFLICSFDFISQSFMTIIILRGAVCSYISIFSICAAKASTGYISKW